MKKLSLIFSSVIIAVSLVFALPVKTYAAKATDEITNYEIVVTPNEEDATLDILYNIDWKVLESDGVGPVSWVKVGIPNSHYGEYEGLTDNISTLFPSMSDGTYMNIYFDKDYYEGETISFSFSVNMDYMYQIDELIEGETVYHFTPGWFNDIAVDNLTVKWVSDKVTSFTPSAITEDGYFIWNTSLAAAEKYQVSVTYPNDVLAFDMSKTEYYSGEEDYYDYGNDYSYDYDYNYNDSGSDAAGVLVLGGIVGFFAIFVSAIKNYSSGKGFSGSETTKKITRTLIKYYPTCPGCGAPRDKEQETCEYCGRSFIESEEIVEEKEIENPKKYENEGTYSYGSSPHTYIRVHVVNVPKPKPSCAHSSCAHSSCACASHCACACACACAGGGRAGCSTKDFYKTGLKLKQLERRNKK